MATTTVDRSGWRYNASGTWVEVGNYSTGSKKQKINSVTIPLGTLGSGQTTQPGTWNVGGATVTGTGAAISTQIRITGLISDSVSVTKSASVTGDAAHGYYPSLDTLSNYTFTFTDLTLAANNAFLIEILAPATRSGSTGQVLCCGTSFTVDYTEINDTEYTITFNSQGGASVSPKKAASGVPISMPNCSKSYTLTYDANKGSVTSPGKSVSCPFRGWSKYADGSGNLYQVNESYTVTKDETFYAAWGDATAGDLAVPTRDRCKFEAWTTSLNGSDVISSSTVIPRNMTIYAKWKYSVRYDGNGGVCDNKTYFDETDTWISHGGSYIAKKYDFYIKPSDPDDEPTETIQNYRLGNSSTGQIISFGTSISRVTDLISLYAQYKTTTFTVTFTDGWSGKVLKTETVNSGENATPPAAPSRPGHTFKGWLGNYINVKANSTVHAYWGFTPVWVYKSGKWVKYEPKEGK